jgi:hypothetical protein
MTKKKLKEIIQKAVRTARGITTQDATAIRDNPYTSICIHWEGTLNMSTIKIMKGKPDDVAIVNEVRKYKRWFLEVGYIKS